MVQVGTERGKRGKGGLAKSMCHAMPCHVPYQAMEMKMEMKTVSSGMKGTVGSVRRGGRVRIVAWKKSKGERYSVCLVFSLMSFSFLFSALLPYKNKCNKNINKKNIPKQKKR